MLDLTLFADPKPFSSCPVTVWRPLMLINSYCRCPRPKTLGENTSLCTCQHSSAFTKTPEFYFFIFMATVKHSCIIFCLAVKPGPAPVCLFSTIYNTGPQIRQREMQLASRRLWNWDEQKSSWSTSSALLQPDRVEHNSLKFFFEA